MEISDMKTERLNVEKQRRMFASTVLWELQAKSAEAVGCVNRLPFLLERENLDMNTLTKYLRDSINEFKKKAEKLSDDIRKYQDSTKKLKFIR